MSEPVLLTDSTKEWPFPIMDANPDAFVEISEETYWYCLEVLPPLYFPGGFAVSEAQRHTAEGAPVYACIFPAGGRYFARYRTLPQAAADAPMVRAKVRT